MGSQVNDETEENLGQEIDALLAQGLSPKDVESQGYSPSLIRQRVRKRKRSVRQPAPMRDYSLAVRKEKESVLPEWLQGEIAEIFDGKISDQKIFMAGMSVPLFGLRLMTEGVKPIIDLLTAWQKGQVEAAQEAQVSGIEMAKTAGEVAASGVAQFLMEAKPWQRPPEKKFDPMQNMMAETIKPYFQQVMGSVMGGLTGMMPQMQPGLQGIQGATPGPTGAPGGQPGNIHQATEDEIEEAFNDD